MLNVFDSFLVGLKCDHCSHGNYNFPKCESCNCEYAGTDVVACNVDGACLCDEDGKCPCKVCLNN